MDASCGLSKQFRLAAGVIALLIVVCVATTQIVQTVNTGGYPLAR
jgi:hypothetical protein